MYVSLKGRAAHVSSPNLYSHLKIDVYVCDYISLDKMTPLVFFYFDFLKFAPLECCLLFDTW